MVTRMTREELVDSSRKDFLNVLPNSWKEKLTIPATSYYVVITMYGFANDSEKEEYIRELIGPRLDSSFRFFSSCIPSSFFFFSLLFFSLSLSLSFIFRPLYWLLIGADGPPRPAEIRRSPAWKSWERVPRIKRIIILIPACHRRIIHACPRRISYGIRL